MENTNTQLLDKIRNIMAEVFKVELDQVPPELVFGDLPQWDSMGHMELMMVLEEDLGIPVTGDTITDLVSVQAIYDYKLGQADA
ncbi:MAG: acyl carrier protein [Anaerolineae bacterium]|nr:acyl carrier protein [Anaerolineae bacterium]